MKLGRVTVEGVILEGFEFTSEEVPGLVNAIEGMANAASRSKHGAVTKRTTTEEFTPEVKP